MAKRLFGFSILYLFVLFAVLLVERGSACSSSACRSDACLHEPCDGPAADRTGHRPHRGAEAPPPRRSIAIALALGVLVALFYAVTLVKGPGVLVRPL